MDRKAIVMTTVFLVIVAALAVALFFAAQLLDVKVPEGVD